MTQVVNIPQCDYKHEFANALLHGYIPTSLCKTVLFAFLQPQLLGICILQKNEKAQKELLPTKHSSMCLRRASREPNVSWQSVVIQSHVRPKRHRTCCNDKLFLICFGRHLYSLHANRIASTRLVLPRMVCWASPCTKLLHIFDIMLNYIIHIPLHYITSHHSR